MCDLYAKGAQIVRAADCNPFVKKGQSPFLTVSRHRNFRCRENYGSTAQFGKKSQTGFLPQFKVWKTKEYCMYFSFFKLKKWGKKTAETRIRNCAVLP